MSRPGRPSAPRTGLRLALAAGAVLVLGWGTVRALARMAPVAQDWAAARWFVGASLALMAVGVAVTLACVLAGPRR